MKSVVGAMLLMGALVCLGQRPALAQASPACQDDEEMTKSTVKDIGDLVGAVKKESLGDFEKFYHQKTFASKSGLGLSVVGGLVDCLDKAAQDSTATKEQVEAEKAKRASYAKLKERIEQTRTAVKSADPKDAKAQIEKLALSI